MPCYHSVIFILSNLIDWIEKNMNFPCQGQRVGCSAAELAYPPIMRWIVDFSNRVILARCCFFEIWQSYVGKLGGESHELVEPNCKVTVVPRQKFAFWARFPRVTPTNLYLPSQLPTLWEPGLIFMQDDASIHTAHIIKNLACWNGNQSGELAFLFSRS